MLEGLEISEVLFSNFKLDNPTFRVDSEFRQKKFVENIELIKSYNKGYKKLGDVVKSMTGGATPLGAEYSDSGIPFLRVQNIMQNYFNLSDVVYIDEQQNKEIFRSSLKIDDVLLTITGVSYGKSAVVSRLLEGANINQHSVKITLKDQVNPFFLSTFFNSKIGKLQSDKNIVGVTRPALDYDAIKNFVIPAIDILLQDEIEKIINNSVNISN